MSRQTKDSVMDDILDWFYEHSEIIVTQCGIKTKDTMKFTHSAKTFVNLKDQYEWLTNSMTSAVAAYNKLYKSNEPEYWARLKLMGTMPELIALKDLAKEVRVEWKKRPRF